MTPGGKGAPTRVLCVDDNADVAELMRLAIDHETDMECVGCLGSADRLLDVAAETRADVVVLDATMPGRDPLDALREAHARLPAVRVLVYSGYDDQESVDRAIEAGVWGYLSKDAGPDRLVAAIRTIRGGEFVGPDVL